MRNDTSGPGAGPRPVRAPRGTDLSCKGWPQEAAMRMLMNNLDPEVAEHPDQLIVYGGSGRAARSWPAFDAIVRSLQDLAADETLLGQPGRPVGPAGKADRHRPHPRMGPPGPDRQLPAGPGVGQLGRVPPPRGPRADQVR